MKQKIIEQIEISENFCKWIQIPGNFDQSYVWFFQEQIESICGLFKR
jgi:hypothetical protein